MKKTIWSVSVVCLAGISLALAQTPAQPPPRYLNLLSSVGGTDKYPIYGVEAGRLAEGTDQSLYTTSKHGGANRCGSVIKFTLNGQFTVLSDFDGSNGMHPVGGLTRGKDGNFYGTTLAGGSNKVGTIFKVSPNGGAPNVLWHFQNRTLNGTNYTLQQKWDAAGGYPYAAPVLAKDGNLYGVTGYANNQKYGVLYRIGAGGGYKAMYYFDGTNGNAPATLIAGADGNLYGTTYSGKVAGNRWGTIFKATTSGSVSTLHEFGRKPTIMPTTLIYGSDGNLYGTTSKGLTGAGGGRGILYKLPLDGKGKFQVLHQFVGGNDGNAPTGLAEGDDGYLYGVAQGGPGIGSVFYRIAKDGQGFKVLANFSGATTGTAPQGNLFRHSNGYLYGTANSGGAFKRGTMFVANPCPLPPRPGQAAFSGGHLNFEDDLVEVRTGVFASQTNTQKNVIFEADDGMTIRVKCVDNPHVVQFIYRERISADGKWYPAQYDWGHKHLRVTNQVPRMVETNEWYYLTTNTNQPVWNTDAIYMPNPYYDASMSYRTDCDSLTIFDQPTFNPPMFVQGKGETWRATFKDFVICGGKVVREINWVRQESPEAKTYIVKPIKTPKPADYAPFQKISTDQGYFPWP